MVFFFTVFPARSVMDPFFASPENWRVVVKGLNFDAYTSQWNIHTVLSCKGSCEPFRNE